MTTATPTSSGPAGRFDFGEVVAEARSLIKGTKRTAVGLTALFAAAFYLLNWRLAGRLLTGDELRDTIVLDALNLPLLALFSLTVTAFGLERVAGRMPTSSVLFDYLHKAPQVAALVVARSLPYYLFVLPGLLPERALTYGLVLFAMAEFYVLDQDVSPVAALGRSVSFMVVNGWRVVRAQFLFVGLLVVTALTVGVGLFWLLPFLYIGVALAYARAEGLHNFAGEGAGTGH